MTEPPDDIVLEVKNLSHLFDTGHEVIKAVDDISLTLRRGKTLCVVGESGSGKSVTARSILNIVPKPGRIVGGQRSPARSAARRRAARSTSPRSTQGRRDPRDPRPRHRDDLPGADVEPEPGAYDRPPDHRDHPAAPAR